MSLTVKQRAGRAVFGHLPITRFLFDQLRFEANVWMFGRSALPALAQDRPHHAPYSLYVEAVKSR